MPTLDQRNPTSLTTVLSGDIGVLNNKDDNSYHVIDNLNLNNTAVLDGFVIRDGYTNLPFTFPVFIGGGGMLNTSSNPSLINCSFQDNSASVGGGMFSIRSSPSLTNCSFQGNSAINFGGGMYNENSNPVLINCRFLGNSAGYGGGMYNQYGGSTLVLLKD